MRSSIKRMALAIGMAGAMSLAFAAPSSALPMSSSAGVLKSAATSDDVTQVRSRGGHRGHSGFRGAGIATGVGLGLLGVGLATGGYGGYGGYGGGGYGYAPAYYGGGYGGYGYPSYAGYDGYGGYGYGPSVSIGFGPSYGYGGGYYGSPGWGGPTYVYSNRRYVRRAYRSGRYASHRRVYSGRGLTRNQANRARSSRQAQGLRY